MYDEIPPVIANGCLHPHLLLSACVLHFPAYPNFLARERAGASTERVIDGSNTAGATTRRSIRSDGRNTGPRARIGFQRAAGRDGRGVRAAPARAFESKSNKVRKSLFAREEFFFPSLYHDSKASH